MKFFLRIIHLAGIAKLAALVGYDLVRPTRPEFRVRESTAKLSRLRRSAEVRRLA